MRSDSFDPLDRQLVHALQLDPRAPFSRVAAVLGVSDQTVARRYSRLRTDGLIAITERHVEFVDLKAMQNLAQFQSTRPARIPLTP